MKRSNRIYWITLLILGCITCSKRQNDLTTILTNNAVKIWLFTNDLTIPVKRDKYHYYVLKKNGAALYYMLDLNKGIFLPLHSNNTTSSKKWNYYNDTLELDGAKYTIKKPTKDTIILENAEPHYTPKTNYLIYAGLNITLNPT